MTIPLNVNGESAENLALSLSRAWCAGGPGNGAKAREIRVGREYLTKPGK